MSLWFAPHFVENKSLHRIVRKRPLHFGKNKGANSCASMIHKDCVTVPKS
jgi:hypothetical protein